MLEKEYKEIIDKYELHVQVHNRRMSGGVIHDAIVNFMEKHHNVAIYCYGDHTKKLMIDYIQDLKDIVCIIDNGNIDTKHQGFKIIKDNEIEDNNIDGIIISTYVYREEIKEKLRLNHAGIEYLDFYDVFRDKGIDIDREYYRLGNPMRLFQIISVANGEIENDCNIYENYNTILNSYIELKDFRMASKTATALFDYCGETMYDNLSKDLYDLYKKELGVYADNNSAVLAMCIDGLRQEEVTLEGILAKTYKALKRRAWINNKAYSFSTSTFESMIPIFTENYDQKNDNYMEKTEVSDCRFVKAAVSQGRSVYVYGSSKKFLVGEGVKNEDSPQSLTQMLWNCAQDMEKDPKGLFYMQPVLESHFSFANPYFKGTMVVDGTSIFFDYLSTKGSKLRGDYSGQYNAAMQYIDDTISEVIDKIACPTVFFADHGNCDYEEFAEKSLEELGPNIRIAAENLFRIPLAIISPQMECEEDNTLISLSELNNIIIALLNGEKYINEKKEYIKVGRTAIYNPDYKYIYNQVYHSPHSILAFEGFVFNDGYKLIVFSDGTLELYLTKPEKLIDDADLAKQYYIRIKNQLTIL